MCRNYIFKYMYMCVKIILLYPYSIMTCGKTNNSVNMCPRIPHYLTLFISDRLFNFHDQF